jgi:hypothetical protein
MADLSTLNPSQKEVYNTYIANDIPEEDAFGLVIRNSYSRRLF